MWSVSSQHSVAGAFVSPEGGVWQATRVLREMSERSHTASQRCHTSAYVVYMKWPQEQQLKSVTEALYLAPARCHPTSLWLTPPSPPRLSLTITPVLLPDPRCHSSAATWSQHSSRRCSVMVRGCQNRCQCDCRVPETLWKAGRSVEHRTLETRQVIFFEDKFFSMSISSLGWTVFLCKRRRYANWNMI